MQREPFGSVTRVTLSAATEIRTHSSPSQPFWLRWMTLLCESKQNVTQTRQFSSSFFGQNTAKKEKILPSFGRNHIESWRFREVFVFVCIFLSRLFFSSFFLHGIVSKMGKNNHILALTTSLTSIVEPAQNTLFWLLLAAEANCSSMNVKIIGKSSSLHLIKRLKACKNWQKLSVNVYY